MKPSATTRQRATTGKAGDWWLEAVFYQILVDRFCRGDNGQMIGNPARPEFCGGNLQGVTARLDYLCRLGVTALWLSPINCTAAYHGDHVTNHAAIEPRFGGLAAFRALLRAAQPDLRIVLDWVPNHVHRTHPFFQSALRTKTSRYRNWFYFDRHGRYRCFLDVAELPKLNLDHPAARQYMIECSLRWLDFGIDGFRLDHAPGPSLGFWREFRAAVKRHNPAAFLVGEATFMGLKRNCLNTLQTPHKHRYFLDAQRGVPVTDAIMREYAGVFDGLLDFQFQQTLKENVAAARTRPASRTVQRRLDAHYAAFPAGCTLPSFLDNHDMNRFLFEARNQKTRLKAAAEIQFRQKPPPIIYYGTEVGMSQTQDVAGPHGDLEARGLMPWQHQDLELLEFYTDLIRKRKRSGAVTASHAAGILAANQNPKSPAAAV
jgi:glycosidase